MIQFTIDQLDSALKKSDPTLLDSASFATRRTSAAQQALAKYYADLRSSQDMWGRASTLNGAAVSTGSEVINTTIGDAFRVAMPTGQLSIAEDSLLLSQGTGKFEVVPRMSMSAIITSGTPTAAGFWENHGEIILYLKEAEITPPGNLHYDYWRLPTIDTTTGSNTIDIKPEDFPSFVDSVLSFMSKS